MSLKVPILTYHSIDKSGSVISTPPNKFRSQMQHLKNKEFNVISLNDIVTHLSEKQPLPSRSVVITFDDGFKNFYSMAYPILKSHGFKATIFLVPGYCGKNNQWVGQRSGIPVLDLLDWDEIKDMANNGIEFGAHTMHHPDLSKLSIEQSAEEIKNSKRTIQQHTGSAVQFFAYPYGELNNSIKALIKNEFYGACSTKLGFVRLWCDIHELPRIDMYYLANNHFLSWLGSPIFSYYIKVRNALRIFKRRFLPF